MKEQRVRQVRKVPLSQVTEEYVPLVFQLKVSGMGSQVSGNFLRLSQRAMYCTVKWRTVLLQTDC